VKLNDLFCKTALDEINHNLAKARRLQEAGDTANALESTLEVIGAQAELLKHFMTVIDANADK
jgi:hypothetical protein